MSLGQTAVYIASSRTAKTTETSQTKKATTKKTNFLLFTKNFKDILKTKDGRKYPKQMRPGRKQLSLS